MDTTKWPSPETVEQALRLWGLTEKDIARVLWDVAAQADREFLKEYQSALSRWAEYMNDTQTKVIVTLDGRDTAGKWSNIKRVTEQFNNSMFWVTAFPWIPSQKERDGDNWFQRYEEYFPKWRMVRFFDRSWYNRAWVEAAMGFCTEQEYNWFMENVSDFERDRIIWKWYEYLKIYLSITKQTQKDRIDIRNATPRNPWKSSEIDAQATEKWWYYSLAKQRILEQTDSDHAPWIILDSNKKFRSAVEIIKAMIRTNDEVRSAVESELSTDLSPDLEVRRTASQELEIMRERWEIDKKSGFKFAT